MFYQACDSSSLTKMGSQSGLLQSQQSSATPAHTSNPQPSSTSAPESVR
ncbi:unnamed protein product [Rodentolepis nana]|uniref:Uncharacterized protein n=1 Tax=Rodentolepis nana TaxID=102285 RepID=A0A3P7SXT4_RODNA|nr:unnamed protein product [Rodentolepis nana]